MQVKPRKAPFFGMMASVLALMGVSQAMIQPITHPGNELISPRERATDESAYRALTSVEGRILVQYAHVRRLLHERRDHVALAHLAALHPLPTPLNADSEEVESQSLMAPGTLYFQIASALIERAQAAAERGDRAGSQRWLRECRLLRERILADKNPTGDTALIARMIHKMALRAGGAYSEPARVKPTQVSMR